MKLSTALMVIATLLGLPILLGLTTTEKLPLLFWGLTIVAIGMFSSGGYYMANGDNKEL